MYTSKARVKDKFRAHVQAKAVEAAEAAEEAEAEERLWGRSELLRAAQRRGGGGSQARGGG